MNQSEMPVGTAMTSARGAVVCAAVTARMTSAARAAAAGFLWFGDPSDIVVEKKIGAFGDIEAALLGVCRRHRLRLYAGELTLQGQCDDQSCHHSHKRRNAQCHEPAERLLVVMR